MGSPLQSRPPRWSAAAGVALSRRRFHGAIGGDVPDNPIQPFGQFGSEVIVGGRVVAHQTIDYAWRVNFLGCVGRAVVWKEFTVGHGPELMMVAFGLAGGVISV
jgi:hypothetical protein